MKKTTIILFIISLMALNIVSAYTISGSSVYINDSNVYLETTPYTLLNSDYVYQKLNSKTYSGNIDFAIGVNSSNAVMVSFEVYRNVTNESGSGMQWVHYNLTQYSYSYDNKDTWFVGRNVPVASGKEYQARFYLNLNPGTNGKYDVAIKPSSETIAQAITNNHFYFLDPWWNSTSNTDYTNTSYWSSINNGNSTVSINNITLTLGVNTPFAIKEDFQTLGIWSKPSSATTIGTLTTSSPTEGNASLHLTTSVDGTTQGIATTWGGINLASYSVMVRVNASVNTASSLYVGGADGTYTAGNYFRIRNGVVQCGNGGAENNLNGDNTYTTGTSFIARLVITGGNVFCYTYYDNSSLIQKGNYSISTGTSNYAYGSLVTANNAVDAKFDNYCAWNGTVFNSTIYNDCIGQNYNSAKNMFYSTTSTVTTNYTAFNMSLNASDNNAYVRLSANNGVNWTTWYNMNNNSQILPFAVQGNKLMFQINLSGNSTYSPIVYGFGIINATLTEDNATESQARTAIEAGINNALTSKTIYYNQRIYTYAGTHNIGKFDLFVVSGNKRWAFNYISGNDTYTNMPSLGTTLNIWENTSLTTEQITAQVQTLINATN